MKIVNGLFAVILISISSAVFADRVFQTSPVLPGPGSDAVGEQGAAWLRRSPDRIAGRVMVQVDNADTPYSIWWIVFNNPEECAGAMAMTGDPCALSDLFNPDVDAAVFNASGAISAADGKSPAKGNPPGGGVINVDLELMAGEGSGNGHARFPFNPMGFDINGLLAPANGCGAEIHLDINEHLVFDEGWVTELTQPEGATHRFAVFPAVEC